MGPKHLLEQTPFNPSKLGVVDAFEANSFVGSKVQALRTPLTQTPLGAVDGFEANPIVGKRGPNTMDTLNPNSIGCGRWIWSKNPFVVVGPKH
jgi:hypothetical protein